MLKTTYYGVKWPTDVNAEHGEVLYREFEPKAGESWLWIDEEIVLPEGASIGDRKAAVLEGTPLGSGLHITQITSLFAASVKSIDLTQLSFYLPFTIPILFLYIHNHASAQPALSATPQALRIKH